MLEAEWQAQAAELAGQPAAQTEPFNLMVPRSRCPHCGRPIRAIENVPVLSWLMLRGRCAGCGARIPARYPLVELLGGVAAGLAAWRFGPSWTAAAAAALSLALIALTFIDIDTQLLPDDLTLPLLWLGLLANLGGLFTDLPSAVVGAMAGYLLLWSVYWLFRWPPAARAWVTATSSCWRRWARGSAGRPCRPSCCWPRSWARWPAPA
jgi:leader peptidase (prepilin peptidase)/N-methyltransferase